VQQVIDATRCPGPLSSASITHVFLILDNVKMHKGRLVQAWLAAHPRFNSLSTPVHCSWMKKAGAVVQHSPA
jgi:hypothetical protein